MIRLLPQQQIFKEVLKAPKANLRPILCKASSICRYDFLAEPYIMQPSSNFDLTRDR